MTIFGIPTLRLLAYLAALALLLTANLWRWGDTSDAPETRQVSGLGDLPELPALATATDFEGFSRPVARNLFRAVEDAPPPPPPEPVKAPEPPPDPEAAARRAAESLLDKVRVIGFLSTSEGVLAVLGYDGSVVNAFEGDTPVPGFRVSQVTIDSVTLSHRDFAIERTFSIGETE